MPDASERIRDEKGNIIQTIEIPKDMTEKKEAEESLQKREEEFRLLFEGAIDAIFWAEPNTGLIIKCNKAAETLLEKKREEIIGCHQITLHPPQKSRYYSEVFKTHIAQKGAVNVEAEIMTKSGKVKPVHITASVTSVGGRQIIQGIFRDITKRKQMEEALLLEKNRLEDVTSSVNCGLLLLDDQLRVTYANRVSEEWFGPFHQIKGKLCWEIFKLKDSEKECAALEALQTGKIVRSETFINSVNGEDKFFYVVASPVKDSKGRILQITEVVVDITERKRMEETLKESEEKFKSLVEYSLVGVYLIQDKVFRYVNPQLAKIFGYSPEELIEKKGPKDLVYIEDWPIVRENLRKRLEGEVESINYRFRGVKKGGETFNVEVFGTQTIYKGQLAVIGTLVDITERLKLENALRQRIKELEEFYDMAVERELKMMRFKDEIKRLKEELEKRKT